MQRFIICATYRRKDIGWAEANCWTEIVHNLNFGKGEPGDLPGVYRIREFDPPVSICLGYPTGDPGPDDWQGELIHYREGELNRMAYEAKLPNITSAEQLREII